MKKMTALVLVLGLLVAVAALAAEVTAPSGDCVKMNAGGTPSDNKSVAGAQVEAPSPGASPVAPATRAK